MYEDVIFKPLLANNALSANFTFQSGVIVFYVQLQCRPHSERLIAAGIIAHEFSLVTMVTLHVGLQTVGPRKCFIANFTFVQPATLMGLANVRLHGLVFVKRFLTARMCAFERLVVGFFVTF